MKKNFNTIRLFLIFSVFFSNNIDEITCHSCLLSWQLIETVLLALEQQLI